MRTRRIIGALLLASLLGACQLVPRYGDGGEAPGEPTTQESPSIDEVLPTPEPDRPYPSPSIEVPPPRY